MSTDLINRIYLTTLAAAAALLVLTAWTQSDLPTVLASPRPLSASSDAVPGGDEGEGSGAGAERGGDGLVEVDQDGTDLLVANTFDPEATEAVADVPSEGSAAAAVVVAPEPLRVGTEDEPCGFALTRHTLARRIERREPAATDGPFVSDGQPVFVYLDADNRGGTPQTATARLVHVETGLVVSGTTDIGVSSRWRTWVELVLPPTHLGAWRAEVMDRDRCQLVSMDFEMVPLGWE